MAFRSCKPVEAAGVKFYGVVTDTFTCRAARSILSAYARRPPTIGEATVAIGRQRYACWVEDGPYDLYGGGCSPKRRRGAGLVAFRSAKWMPPSYAMSCDQIDGPPQTNQGIFAIRMVSLDCDTTRAILTEWTAADRSGDGSPGWAGGRVLPQPADVRVACADPRVWYDLG